jgi:hypothetical protein
MKTPNLGTYVYIKFTRAYIRWNNFKKKRLTAKKPEIDNTQRKAIDLFLAMMKNKETNLNHSPESGARFIDSKFVWACMTSAGDSNNYIINVINEIIIEEARSHEVLIPKEYAYELIEEFDLELERRFRMLEIEKQKMVVNDLDKLILTMKN